MNDPLKSEIIALAWADDTSFDAIKSQTGLAEKDVIQLMRRSLKPRSFKLWRKRVTGRKSKHLMNSKAFTRRDVTRSV